MHSRLSSVLMAALLISAVPSPLQAMNEPDPLFTLQVASFADRAHAERFALELVRAGESPILDTVDISGRGFWTRIFLGLFADADAARQKGVSLLTRGVIREFLIKTIDSTQSLTRPRRAGMLSKPPGVGWKNGSLPHIEVPGWASNDRQSLSARTDLPVISGRGPTQKLLRDAFRPALPVAESRELRIGKKVDTSLIPRPDPVSLAFKLITGEPRHTPGTPEQRGGLWVSGDTTEGLERLRWIAGEQNAHAIKLGADGRVQFDLALLAKAAGRGVTRVEDPLEAVEYISSNEGLLLLVQVSQARFRYLLHFGRLAPTYGKSVDTAGSINLDNNIDSRINPYRKNGRKLDSERPPDGFDSLVAMNPVARWFNLNKSLWVHPGEIVFHELAEAYAKLEFDLDYLDQGSRLGAHAVALVREARLKSQRPDADIVITTGSNRLLRTEAEIRLFTAEASAGVNQR